MPIRRTIKNVVRNYTDSQVKVREATSNDPWGPSSTMMSEIADLTYNVVAFTEIMQMVWKRLNDHGKNWRHVYKALVLLDYIIKTGSEKVAQQCKENIFAIETLKNFQYVEDGKDHGMNVREKAKQLVQLLKDDERLRNERAKALKAKERFAQSTMGIGSTGQRDRIADGADSPPPSSGYSDLPSGGGYLETSAAPAVTGSSEQNSDGPVNPELEAARPSTAGEEELQLQLALAMSREEHDEEEKRKKQDDLKLQMALEESQKGAPATESGNATSYADTLLDLSAGAAAVNSPNSSGDPWDPSSQEAAAADPWGGNSKPATADPWGAPSSTSTAPATSSASAADPWSGPLSSSQSTPLQQQQSGDPWGGSAPPSNGTAGKGLDDEFDMLSSRKSPQTTSQQTGMLDLDADATTDQDDLFGLGAAAAALGGGG